MTLASRIFLFLGLAVFAGCSPSPQQVQPSQTPEPARSTQTSRPIESTHTRELIRLPSSTPDPRQIILIQNKEKWDSQKVIHYRFKLNVICFCRFRPLVPVTIEVRSGQIISVLDANGAVVGRELYEDIGKAGTVEGLFEIAESGISEADRIIVRYDDTYGFPTLIDIDPTEAAIDDDYVHEISNFEILP